MRQLQEIEPVLVDIFREIYRIETAVLAKKDYEAWFNVAEQLLTIVYPVMSQEEQNLVKTVKRLLIEFDRAVWDYLNGQEEKFMEKTEQKVKTNTYEQVMTLIQRELYKVVMLAINHRLSFSLFEKLVKDRTKFDGEEELRFALDNIWNILDVNGIDPDAVFQNVEVEVEDGEEGEAW